MKMDLKPSCFSFEPRKETLGLECTKSLQIQGFFNFQVLEDMFRDGREWIRPP